MADVQVTELAKEELDALPRVIRTRMLQLLEQLKAWPKVSGAKPLRGNLAGCYRLRTGDHRLQLRVVGEKVVVERIGHRDGFYET